MRRFLILLAAAVLFSSTSPSFAQFKTPDQRGWTGQMLTEGKSAVFRNLITFNGGILDNSTAIIAGTISPVLIAGDLGLTGTNGSGPTFNANSEGAVWVSTVNGISMAGDGSNYDFTVRNKNNTQVFVVPTGTTNISLLGNIGFTTSNVLWESATNPTISTGFCGSPSIANANGTAAFTVAVGTSCSATTGVVTMPTASHGWACSVNDVTTTSASVFITKVTAETTTSVTVGNFSDTANATTWNSSDVLQFMCAAY